MAPEARPPGPILLDSALGTRLASLGLDFNTSDACLWNLTHPEQVVQCHAADLAAGARYLTSNTFGANRAWLEKFGQASAIHQINARAVALARQALAGHDSHARVIGNIGPTALENKAVFQEQAELLASAGVGVIYLETLTAPQALAAAGWLDQMRFCIPVWMSLWNWGEQPATTAKIMQDSGVQHWGVNCINDLKTIRFIFESLIDSNLPAQLFKPSAMPIADFLNLARDCHTLGARYFGGCCGTDATYIAALCETFSMRDSYG